MQLFSKPISALETKDLVELLDERAVENLRLEFKRDIPTRDESLKKISAFANTQGGQIVVGAEADKKGRISGLPGVDPPSGYKQTIVQWCFGGVSPPIDVEVSDGIPSPANPQRVCYVIRTRESDVGPHFINGRKGVFVRSDEFSSRFEAQSASENELRHLFRRRELVSTRRIGLLSRARQRFEIFTHQKYKELGKGRKDKGIGARFDLCVGPRFPVHPLTDQAALFQLVPNQLIPWRQVGFPRSTAGFISQHESVIGMRPGSSFSILEVNTWGMLYYATEVELQHEQYQGNHVYHFLGQLLVFLEHAGLTLKQLAYAGPLVIDMKLEGFRGVPWIYSEYNSAATGPASDLDDGAEFSLETTVDDLVIRRDGLAIDIMRYVFFATNWPDAANNTATLETWIRKGYQYNLWPVPGQLRV